MPWTGERPTALRLALSDRLSAMRFLLFLLSSLLLVWQACSHTVNSIRTATKNPPPDRNALKRMWGDAWLVLQSERFNSALSSYPSVYAYAMGIEHRPDDEGHAGIKVTLYGANWTDNAIPGGLRVRSF